MKSTLHHSPLICLKYKENIFEPDIGIICDRDKHTDRSCAGAPDWINEIVSQSNSGHDYVRKLNLYLDAGVREYWIVNPMKETIYVYHLEENQFETSSYTFQDKIKVNISITFLFLSIRISIWQ